MRRWTLFLLGLAASAALTVSLWAAGIPGFFLFLLFPLLLWPRRTSPERVCPTCGHTTMHPAVRYCPHDGTRMEHPEAHRSTQPPETTRPR